MLLRSWSSARKKPQRSNSPRLTFWACSDLSKRNNPAKLAPVKDLTQGSVTKHLLHMSAFLAASMLVQTLYLLADLYWVGHLGTEAIAAVGVAGNLTMIVLALTQMLGVGTPTLMSQAAGRKDQPHAEVVFNQSFVMSILIALGLGVVGFILRPVYCDSLSADAETAQLAKAYLLWFLPGLLLQFPLVALSAALRATGIIKPAVGFQVLSVFLNIVLAPLLIFGIGPWPKLGVTGAALAPDSHRHVKSTTAERHFE
jgi:MATE family, multidrug efflux pump